MAFSKASMNGPAGAIQLLATACASSAASVPDWSGGDSHMRSTG
jgi:hypothetical protein